MIESLSLLLTTLGKMLFVFCQLIGFFEPIEPHSDAENKRAREMAKIYAEERGFSAKYSDAFLYKSYYFIDTKDNKEISRVEKIISARKK